MSERLTSGPSAPEPRGNGRSAVLCVGRVYCDVILTDVPRLPTPGTEVFAGGVSLTAGGGAAITAGQLAALGRRCFLAASLPAAPFDTIVQAQISGAGIETSMLRHATPGADPQLTVALVTGGERAFVTRKSGPAAPDLSGLDLGAMGIGHLHIGELATLVEHPDLVAVARAAGLTISLDCGWDDAVTAQDASLIGGVDLFLPNLSEVEHLQHLGVTAPFGPLTVVKQGAGGATAYDAGQMLHAATPAVEQVVDTTGAGDAFNGGFLHRWLDAAPLAACLETGNLCGAQAVSHAGGFGGFATAADDVAMAAAASSASAR